MPSLQEMSDHFDIQQLFVNYSYAIDQRDWAALDDVFTPDAVIDYTEMYGERGTLPEIKKFLDRSLKDYSGSQHLNAASQIKLHGDTADSRTILFNPMIVTHEGAEHVFFCGCWYRDKLVRTPNGWRIKERAQERSYYYNVPKFLGFDKGS